MLDDARKAGFARARIDGMVVRLEDVQGLEKLKKHTIELVVDRLTLDSSVRARLTDSVETALRAGGGQLRVQVDGEDRPRAYSEARGCPKCGVGLPELSPQLLSFNSPLGMCETCHGLGQVDLGWEHEKGEGWQRVGKTCGECEGLRLRPEARTVFLGGKSITDAVALTVEQAAEHFKSLQLAGAQGQIAAEILKEVHARLGFLLDVGLEYLTLDRASGTLSGGEAQRIRLASQLGSELSGVMYVLDEPSIGLHPARQHAPREDARAAARPRQQRARGRARPGDDRGRRLRARLRSGRRPRGGEDRRPGHAQGDHEEPAVAHGPFPERHGSHRGAKDAAKAARLSRDPGRQGEQPQERGCAASRSASCARSRGSRARANRAW